MTRGSAPPAAAPHAPGPRGPATAGAPQDPGPGAAVALAVGRRRSTVVLLGLGVAVLASVLVAACLGPVLVAPADVAAIIGHHVAGLPAQVGWPTTDDAIIWQVRTPRVVQAVLVGAALGTTGMVLQALVRNPLAEPHLLGVTAGASTGAAAAILLGVGAGLGARATSVMAFLGALGALALALLLAGAGRGLTPGRMLVAGVSVGYLLSSTTSLLIVFADSEEAARAVVFWLLGSLAQADWESQPVLALAVGAALVLLLWWRRRLDLLTLGDDVARSAGIDPGATRWVLLVVVALCVGAAVAVSGAIGFVGLAVPHLARRLVGTPHRVALPASALLGALLLLWADVVARLVVAPRELPIGVVTGLVGAPVLVVLVRRLHTADS